MSDIGTPDAPRAPKKYVTKGRRRRLANRELKRASQSTEDEEESPYKRSRGQGQAKAAKAVGVDVLKNLKNQFDAAKTKDEGDAVLKATLALGKLSEHEIHSAFNVGAHRLKRGGSLCIPFLGLPVLHAHPLSHRVPYVTSHVFFCSNRFFF